MQLSDDFYRDGRSTLQVKSSFFLFCFEKDFQKSIFVSESITAIDRRPETLSPHPKLWAASVTGTLTGSLSHLPQTQVNCFSFSVLAVSVCSLSLWKTYACKKNKKTTTTLASFATLLAAYELLVPSPPEAARVERGYVTPLQVYNLLNAEDGQPALFDPHYILILDCRSAERFVHNIKLGNSIIFRRRWMLKKKYTQQNIYESDCCSLDACICAL